MNQNFGHGDAALASGEALTNLLNSIVRNQAIDQFLDGDEKSFIVGPKGTGKTIMLLKKALHQQENRSVHVVSGRQSRPVDHLTCAEDLGTDFLRRTASPTVGRTAWIAAWKNSIMKACLHSTWDLLRTASPEFSTKQFLLEIQNLLRTPYLSLPKTTFDYYAEIMHFLDSSPVQGVEELRVENLKIKQLLSAVDKPIYVYMDNLDSYYESNPDLWFQSMYGSFRAVLEIVQEFRHIHVFMSLRKDIFNKFDSEHRQQFLGSISE